MVASVTRDNSVNQSFKFDITTSGKQKYYRLSSEDVARFLTEDYNRTDNVKTSKLSLFEKFIYIITFGMCDISCDKRNSLKDFFTGFESAINSLDGTFRNPDLHSEPLTECTNLADHNLPAETKALFMIDRFAKLAKCALDVVQARVDINLFAVVFEPSNYGMAPDKLKFMIGNTCITAIDCDRLTRKNLIKTLSNRPDIYEHLNVKKLYIDDKKLVKQYAFEQKRDVLYLDGMLYGAKTGAGLRREYGDPVGKGAYGTVYVERGESESNKSSDHVRLAKKFEIVRQSGSDKRSTNCSSKLVANLKKSNKDYQESGSVSVNQVAYSAKYQVVIADKNSKSIDVIQPHPQKKDQIKPGEMYYNSATSSFNYKATVEGARVVAKIKIPGNINQTNYKDLLQGIVSKKGDVFDINYGKVVYDEYNNQVKYAFIEDSEGEAEIKVIQLPENFRGCKDLYKVRDWLYKNFPPNDPQKRLEVAVCKTVGTTDRNVKPLDDEHINSDFSIFEHIARSIFELQVAGGFGLDGKRGNILVKSDEHGKIVKTILIDRDTDLLVMESLYNKPEYSIDDFETITKLNVNRDEQTTMAIAMDDMKGLFNKLFDLNLSNDGEIKNLKAVNSENMRKFYVLSGLFGHLYSVFGSSYFTKISIDYTDINGEKKQRKLDKDGKGWAKQDIEEARKHWDKALPNNIAEIMEVDDSKWKENPHSNGKGFRDSLLDFVTLWKVRDAADNFTDQDYNKVKQFMNMYYDHIKSKADEKGINFSDYTNVENPVLN